MLIFFFSGIEKSKIIVPDISTTEAGISHSFTSGNNICENVLMILANQYVNNQPINSLKYK